MFAVPSRFVCLCRAVLSALLVIGASAAAEAQAPGDIVLHAADATINGAWQKVSDPAAAGTTRVWHPNTNAAKITQASATPQHYFDLQFSAESARAYRLWIRSRADANHWANDSVFVQFSSSVNAAGSPIYRIGTTSATTVVREDCSGCAFGGWGWQDNEYGNTALGPEIRFARSGLQTIRVQAREDGIAIDQIVLSSATWFTTPPGARNNDATILPKTTGQPEPAGSLAFISQRYSGRGLYDALAAADLNGDAKLDIAGVYFDGTSVSSAINDGGRAFHLGHAEDYWTSAAAPARVVAADFNRDSKVDLLELDTFRNFVAVFLGDGTGGFSTSVTTTFAQPTADVAVADFTGDGIADIAVVEPDTGNIAVRAGNGAGAFSASSSAVACNKPTEIVAGDFNGDRRQDVALICSGDRVVRVLSGDGGGRFTASSDVLLTDALSLGATDIDGNGYSDLVIGSGPHFAYILHSSSQGFTGTSHLTSDVQGAQIVPRGIAFGDMNGDGRRDVVVTHRHTSNTGTPATFAIVPNTGNGTYGHPEDFAKTSVLPAVVADLDGDGRRDVISPESAQGFSVFWNDPAAANRAPVANAGPDATVMDADQASFRLDGRGSRDADGHAIAFEWVTSDGARRLFGATPLAFEGGGYQPGTYTFRLRVDDLQGGESIDTVTITIQRPSSSGNRPPVADAFVSLSGVWPYEKQFQDMPDPETFMISQSTDPDGDTLTHEWKNAAGHVISTSSGWDTATLPALRPGTHTFTLTVRDGRGGASSDTVSVTVTNYEEIVIAGAGYKENPVGSQWQVVEDPGGAHGYVVRDADAGAPKLNAPLASPANYVDFSFVADPTLEYKLWIRLKAQNDYWGNDSIWVQLDGAVDAAGNPVFRSGTTSGLSVNLEECSGCGVSGWGWRDDAYGAAGTMSSRYLRFPAGGVQTLRIQTREDGVSISHIVLSAKTYKTSRPGAVKNDTTRLNHNAFWGS